MSLLSGAVRQLRTVSDNETFYLDAFPAPPGVFPFLSFRKFEMLLSSFL